MLHKMIILLSIILCIIINVQLVASSQCTDMETTSITQKIENDGFHKEIKWLIERNENNDCRLVLKLDVPNGLYVNPDEIADLNRLGKISAYIEGCVNIELPSHLVAEKHQIYIYLPNADKVFLQIPIHLRYQRAQISGSFGKVIVDKPSLLIHCQFSDNDNNSNFCGNHEDIQASCSITNRQSCQWRNISYQALFDEVELLVPIGDLDDYPLVSIVTLLLGCAGCIYVLSILSTTPL